MCVVMDTGKVFVGGRAKEGPKDSKSSTIEESQIPVNGTRMTEIAKLIDSVKVKVFVETALTLSEARRAQEMSQTGRTRGRIVLRVM